MSSQVSSALAGQGDLPDPRNPASALSPEAFASYLASHLGLDVASLAPGARLIEDLELDSLRMLELVLTLDGMGAHLDAEELCRARRVGDLYRIYVERRSLAQYATLVCEAGAGSRPGDDPRAALRRRMGAQLSSRRTRQRAVLASDYPYLHELAREDGALLSRHGDHAPSPESFATALWDGVLVQHVIVDVATDAPVGLVTAYDADMLRGIAYLDLALERRARGRGWPLEALALFVSFVFRTWPLRKLCARVLAHRMEAIASGLGRLFVAEGRLVKHEYCDGAWVDVHLLAIFREQWDEDAPGLLPGLSGPCDPGKGATSAQRSTPSA